MKKSKLFGLALVATMASFSACSNNAEDVLAQESEIRLTSEITPSRVTSDLQSDQIAEGQEIGVTITGSKSGNDYINKLWTSDGEGGLSTTQTVYWANTDIDVIAYHPYNEEWTNDTPTFTVSTDQSEDENYLNSDLLFSKMENVEKRENAISLTFSHKLAKINVTLQPEYQEMDLSSAVISICNTKTSTTIDLSDGTVPTEATGDIQEIIAGTGSTASAIVAPQTVASGTQFIKVALGAKTFYYTLPAEKQLKSGYSHNYILTVKETALAIANSSEIDNWIPDNDEGNTGDANESEALPQIDGEVFQSKLTTLSDRYSITKITFKTNSTPETEATEISEGVEAVNDNGVITVHINASSAQITSGKNMFGSFYSLQAIEGFSLLETGAMTNMDGMFAECHELTSIDFSNLDTSNVTSMEQVFSSNTKLTSLDLSNFNTSKVTNMCGMFSALPFSSLDLSNFDTSTVTTMNQMFIFSQMTSLDLSNFDTSKVEDMTYMFNYCENLNSIKMMGDVSNVTSVLAMFDGVKENGTFYYNQAYDYSKIIEVLPSSWTAIPVTE